MEEFSKGFKFGLGFFLANIFLTIIISSIVLVILAISGFRIHI